VPVKLLKVRNPTANRKQSTFARTPFCAQHFLQPRPQNRLSAMAQEFACKCSPHEFSSLRTPPVFRSARPRDTDATTFRSMISCPTTAPHALCKCTAMRFYRRRPVSALWRGPISNKATSTTRQLPTRLRSPSHSSKLLSFVTTLPAALK
jgi:hypothetical protein